MRFSRRILLSVLLIFTATAGQLVAQEITGFGTSELNPINPASDFLGGWTGTVGTSSLTVTGVTTFGGGGIAQTLQSPVTVSNTSSLTLTGALTQVTGPATFTITIYDSALNTLVYDFSWTSFTSTSSSVTAQLNTSASTGNFNGTATAWELDNDGGPGDTVSFVFNELAYTSTIGTTKQTITFPTIATQTFGSAPFSLDATASSGLTVTYTVVSGPATVSGNTVTLTGAGTVTIRASQSGNSTYAAATPVNQTFTVKPGVATVTLSNLTATYDGSPQAPTVTTTPSTGVTVTLTYAGKSTEPTAAGSYAIVATASGNYTGSAKGTFVITKAVGSVTLGNLSATYTGAAQSATAVTNPVGLPVTFTYNGKSSAPVAAGTYAVVGTINNANYAGSASGSMTISPATATVNFGALTFNYTGRPIAVTATTVPARLAVSITYDGSATAPTAVGNYSVQATVNNADYTGSASGTLTINPAAPLVTTGSATGVTATSATLNATTDPKTNDTHVYFQYGTSTAYGSATLTQDVGNGNTNIAFSSGISFTASTTAVTYHYRAVADNGGGTVNGADKTFIALPVPTTSVSPQIALAASSAEATAAVNPNGVATTVYFQYGTTGSYGSTTAVQSLGAGKTAVNVFALFPNLQPNTLYYYRMVTVSAAGTFDGPRQSFTTLGFDVALVAEKGESATGTTSTFATLDNPAINASETVTFAATLTTGGSITSANDVGIWTVNSSNTQQLIAQLGGAAPGTSGVFATLGNPLINDNGAVAFRCALKVAAGQATSSTANGIWSSSSGSLALVARQGSAAPGTVGTFSTFGSLGLSDSGAVFYATLNNGTGITSANNAGIWEGNTTSDLHQVLALGQVVGGKTITKLVFQSAVAVVNGQTRNYDASGDIVAQATFSNGSNGIVSVIGGTAAIVAETGVAVPTLSNAEFTAFSTPAIDNSGTISFEATTNSGVALTERNVFTTDGTGEFTYQSNSGSAPADPILNNNARLAYTSTVVTGSGRTAATHPAIYYQASPLVQQGGQAPGCPAGATFATFTELALPDQGGADNNGGVVFLGTLTTNTAAGVTSTNNLGIWAVDNNGNVQLVARTGDIIGGKTVTGLSFLPALTDVTGNSRSFNASGDLVYIATFSDGSTAVIEVIFP
jgi:hypothetical protein